MAQSPGWFDVFAYFQPMWHFFFSTNEQVVDNIWEGFLEFLDAKYCGDYIKFFSRLGKFLDAMGIQLPHLGIVFGFLRISSLQFCLLAAILSMVFGPALSRLIRRVLQGRNTGAMIVRRRSDGNRVLERIFRRNVSFAIAIERHFWNLLTRYQFNDRCVPASPATLQDADISPEGRTLGAHFCFHSFWVSAPRTIVQRWLIKIQVGPDLVEIFQMNIELTCITCELEYYQNGWLLTTICDTISQSATCTYVTDPTLFDDVSRMAKEYDDYLYDLL